MDKKKKIWAGLVLFLCAVLIVQFFYSSPSRYFRADDGADGVYEVYIDDSYGLLDSEEQENLRRIMLDLTEYGNMVFASSNSIVGNTREKARDVYQSNFGRESGVLFFIDMSNRTIWIESYGDARNALSSSVCYEITDRTYNYATGGNYYECAEETFSRVGEVLRRGFLFPTMRVLISLCISEK